jgi:hypothetical protein
MAFSAATVFSAALSPVYTQRHSGLAAAAASTTISAAHGNSISHGSFMRVTAAVAPNRKLCDGLSVFYSIQLANISTLLRYSLSK